MESLNFELNNLSGELISLDAYKGKKVLVSFFRDTTCPFCNLRVRELINHYDELKENNIDVIAIYPSSVEKIRKYSGKQNAPFEMLADPEEKIYKKIAIRYDKLGMLKSMLRGSRFAKVMTSGFMNSEAMKTPPMLPVDILIDENQKIIKRLDGTYFGDHIPIVELLKWK